jgi:hypothetical protein
MERVAELGAVDAGRHSLQGIAARTDTWTMPDRQRTLIAPLATLLVVCGLAVALRPRTDSAPAHNPAQALTITPAQRDATFTFAPDVLDVDRQAILGAVARARPEAQRLIAEVDGLVRIEVAKPPEHALGMTTFDGQGISIVLDLAGAAQAGAQRGIARVVLHELGHAVDFALVPDGVVTALDAQVPERYGCLQGVGGACTNNAEVFAESFAKWATGDIGMDIYAGYAVPPPVDLDRWGKPLEQLLSKTKA